MEEKQKTINVAVTGIGVSVVFLAIMIFIGLKCISNSIDSQVFTGSYLGSPGTIITPDINNKDFLTIDEASQYLGVSCEALITVVNNGSYNGNYTKEIYDNYTNDIIYIFPREELKNWFNEYMKTHKTIKADSSYLPPKEIPSDY